MELRDRANQLEQVLTSKRLELAKRELSCRSTCRKGVLNQKQKCGATRGNLVPPPGRRETYYDANDLTEDDVAVAYDLHLSEALGASQRDAWHIREAQQSDDQLTSTVATHNDSDSSRQRLAGDRSVVAIRLRSNSQDDTHSNTSSARRDEDEQRLHLHSVCNICLARKPALEFVVLEPCWHRFCTVCLSRYVETKVQSAQVPVRCPQQGCLSFMCSHDYPLLTISAELLARLTKLEVVGCIPVEERYYCPFPDCSAFMTKPPRGQAGPGGTQGETGSRALRASQDVKVVASTGGRRRGSSYCRLPWPWPGNAFGHGVLFRGSTVGGRDGTIPSSSGGISIGAVECFSCHRLFCAECQVPWHPRYTCTQFQKLKPAEMRNTDSESEAAFKQLMHDEKWMTCVQCGHVVERAKGCSHMTCRCGYQFCYECGEKWGSFHLCVPGGRTRTAQ